MKRRYATFFLAFLFAGCASGTPGAEPPAPSPRAETTAPEPDATPPASAAAGPRTAAPEPALIRAPDAWQLLDLDTDRVPGTSATRTYRELLNGRQPARTVVVAVIDGGVDTMHVDLRPVLWRNDDEEPGNGADDDGNGYVDDVYGWNFIGGPDGQNVHHETMEITRLYAQCQVGQELPRSYDCTSITEDYEAERAETEATYAQIQQIKQAMAVIVPMLQQALGGAEPTAENVGSMSPATPQLQQAQQLFLQLDAAGITSEDIDDALESYEGLLQYGFDPEFETRSIVGDDFADGTERAYGNADVMGPDSRHGTHVAGIIGAVRENGVGMDGVASGIRLMTIRTVPDGDERDKDVANAIRYAVDNGAHVINMSFGKSYSPRKQLVDEAIRYADERGVLMIHAAGNDGEDVDVEANFPTPHYDDGTRAQHWITVGAANWVVDSLAAPFSNYGQTEVDLFAPGVAILSTVPGSEFEREDGTSMAAPVVTGVAALLMAYFPDLSAMDVKRILLESSVKYGDRMVPQPGSGEPVPFGTLSVTGGVVNVYEAVRTALERM